MLAKEGRYVQGGIVAVGSAHPSGPGFDFTGFTFGRDDLVGIRAPDDDERDRYIHERHRAAEHAGDAFELRLPAATSLPAQFTIDVPADASLGTYSLAALGTSAGGAETAVTVEIDVERSDLPSGLAARVPQIVFDRQAQQSEISLIATFADGNVLDATRSSRVTYASSDPTVVTVDPRGVLRGVGSGVAEILATYTLASETLSALVRVIVPPPPYRLSPSSLDFGQHSVATPSSLGMTSTNTSGELMSIVSVAAAGDYTKSTNYVSAPPVPGRREDIYVSITI